jgi:hypothetical protein
LRSELVAELAGQVDGLRRKVERKDTIIMQIAQRIPELEAPPGARESPVRDAERLQGAFLRGHSSPRSGARGGAVLWT